MAHRHLAAALGALTCAACLAQPVWRCGASAPTYTDQPCPQGRAVDAADPRSADDREAARKVADDDKRLAETLARQRRDREREAQPFPAGFRPASAPAARPAVKPAAAKTARPKRAKKTRKAAKPQAAAASAPVR